MGLADAFPEAAGPGTALPEAMLGMAGASPVGRCSDNTHPGLSMQRGPPVTPLQVMGRGALLRGTEFKRRRVGVYTQVTLGSSPVHSTSRRCQAP